jgi:hypothetical protein
VRTRGRPALCTIRGRAVVARLYEHPPDSAPDDATHEAAQESVETVAGVSGGPVEGGDRDDCGRGRQEFPECRAFRCPDAHGKLPMAR